MNHLVAVLLFIALVCLASSSQAQTAAANEAYAIYSAGIRGMFRDNKVAFDTQAKIQQFIIREETVTSFARGETESWQQVKIQLPDLSQETIADFEKNLKTKTKLTAKFDLPLPYVLLSNKSYASLFPDKPGVEYHEVWKPFYKAFPEAGGYVSLSNIGFNKSRDEALVYFVHWCNWLCGSGLYLQFAKVDGTWNFKRAARVWVS